MSTANAPVDAPVDARGSRRAAAPPAACPVIGIALIDGCSALPAPDPDEEGFSPPGSLEEAEAIVREWAEEISQPDPANNIAAVRLRVPADHRGAYVSGRPASGAVRTKGSGRYVFLVLGEIVPAGPISRRQKSAWDALAIKCAAAFRMSVDLKWVAPAPDGWRFWLSVAGDLFDVLVRPALVLAVLAILALLAVHARDAARLRELESARQTRAIRTARGRTWRSESGMSPWGDKFSTVDETRG